MANKNCKYKILIFDLDDTLIDNKENVKHAFKEMLKLRNIEYSDSEFSRWYEIDKQFWEDRQDGLIEIPNDLKNEEGKKSKKILDWLRAQRIIRYFSGEIELDDAINLNSVFIDSMSEVVTAIDGAYEILEYLSKQYKILIATNGPEKVMHEKLVKIDCLKFIDEVLSAEMFGYMKPDERFFDGIQCMLNNFNDNEYLIIGNSLKSDVGFGMNCGFDSCWFDRKEEVLTTTYNPTMVIEKLTDLFNIL